MRVWTVFKRVSLLLFLVWIVYQAGEGIYELYKLKQKERRIQVEIVKLQAKQVVLERRRLFLKTKKGIETIATKRLGMIPPSSK